MRRLRDLASDAFVSSVALTSVLVVAGLVSLGLAWRGAAAHVRVADQLPWLVSGGLGGLGLVAFAGGVLVIQHRRWVEARSRAGIDRVVDAAREAVDLARREGHEQ